MNLKITQKNTEQQNTEMEDGNAIKHKNVLDKVIEDVVKELKPCPFCGKKDYLRLKPEWISIIQCEKCRVSFRARMSEDVVSLIMNNTRVMPDIGDFYYLIKGWNTRYELK